MKARLLQSFDDPSLGAEQWENVLARGATETVFLLHPYQRAWWNCFGHGQLLLITAEKQGQIVALAPLFAEAGMIFFVGSGGSDYLDFIGDTSNPGVFDVLLEAARSRVSDLNDANIKNLPRYE